MKLVKYTLLTLLTLITLASCGGSSSDSNTSSEATNDVTRCLGSSTRSLNSRIINGELCTNGASPVVEVLLTGRDSGTAGLCTGTVIAANKVLTAAHCFLEIEVVETFVNTEAGLIATEKVAIHPGAALGTDAIFNDVAVITTSQDLNLPTVPLYVSREIQIGETIGITGFGLTQDDIVGQLNGGLMQVTNVSENHIFADFNGGKSNTCRGDSGGPATFTTDSGEVGILGVVSTGLVFDCSAGDTTLFANVQNPVITNFIISEAPSVGLL